MGYCKLLWRKILLKWFANGPHNSSQGFQSDFERFKKLKLVTSVPRWLKPTFGYLLISLTTLFFFPQMVYKQTSQHFLGFKLILRNLYLVTLVSKVENINIWVPFNFSHNFFFVFSQMVYKWPLQHFRGFLDQFEKSLKIWN